MTVPFTEHPCLQPVTREMVAAIVAKYGGQAPDKLAEIEQKRREAIAKAKADPLRNGFELEWWRDADGLLALPETRLVCVFGGNGSGKSTWGIKRGMQIAFERPRAKVLCLHEDEDASIDVHQAMAYEFLPSEVKPREGWKPRKSLTTNIVYDTKNGFVGNSFTTPKGGKVQFGNYRQSVKRWEGGGWSFIVADENFPLSWLVTLLYRLGRAGGQMVWPFTAIDGITPAIDEVVRGAQTLRSRPVDERIFPAGYRVSDDQDWPNGFMPYVQQATKPEVKILYAHSDLNPLSGYDPEQGRGANYGYEDMIRILQDRPMIERERRAYGYARKTRGSVFPKFCAVHQVPAARMREMLARIEHTKYMVIDPAGARNFFMIWFAVDEHGRHYLYREWPDVLTVGEWALPSDDPHKWDGKPGAGQDKLGHGVAGYKELILNLEGWTWREGAWVPYREEVGGQKSEVGNTKRTEAEVIFQRFIDPRSGATEAMAGDAGESSLIDRFLDEQDDGHGHIVGPSMDLEPAESGKTEEDGLMQLTELLDYDQRAPIVALLNEPLLYVSSECENVIWALAHYTAHDGPKAACKDPIDCARYMALKKCIHVHASALAGTPGGGWR